MDDIATLYGEIIRGYTINLIEYFGIPIWYKWEKALTFESSKNLWRSFIDILTTMHNLCSKYIGEWTNQSQK